MKLQKEEDSTPPKLAKQYKLNFIHYLESSSYFGNQSPIPMPKKFNESGQILQEHSYFKKRN